MKLIKAIIIVILAVFITATLGFTSIINSEDKIHGNPVIKTQTSQEESVDFMSGNDYLSVFPDIAHPGDSVYFKLRVYNNTPDNGYCGGSTVRFIMNGRVVDEVPFFLHSGEAYKDVSARLFLPEGDYSSLPYRHQVSIDVQAIIDPYNRTPESNEDNNNAASQFIVEGKKQVVLQDINQDAIVDVAGLSVWSVKNDTPNDKISAALPGQKLNLKARIYPNSSHTKPKLFPYVNVKFVLNGIVIKEFKMQVTSLPSSGYLELNAEYFVPINAIRPFDFTVILDNGSQASIKIPIIRWDVGINTSDMYWSGEAVAVPGKNISLKAIIRNTTFLKFPFDFNKIAYRVLIDGEVFYEDSFFLSSDSNYPYIPAYKVPAGRTTPIQYTIVLDPYDQLKESDEANNTATITIPIQNTGSTGPDFSISASDLSYVSKPILPGSQVKLSAAILNNSNSYLTKDLRVQFKINEAIIADFKVDRHFLHPLQCCLVTKNWTVPQNLPDNPVFEVVLDPEDPTRDFAGEKASDNTASVILDTYGPDLEVTADCLSWLPKEPQAGGSVTLYAGIRNTGLASTKTNCTATFFINGTPAGEPVVVPPIAGVSGFVASCSWSVPAAPELSPIEWNTLKGEPGKLPLPSGATKDYNFKVQVDSGNQITETNENNNIAEKNLTVYVPYNKAVVYVRVFDVVGNISGAEVELNTADGKTARTTSDNSGWCTFTGLPYGSYTITVRADKCFVKTVTSEVKTTSLVHYREVELTRDTKQFPYFTATASTLEGITALEVDFNSEILDPRITDSDFYFQWYDGENLISESKSFSYAFVKPGTYEVTFYIKKLNYDIVASKSFNINVLPPEFTFEDEGRILYSTANIFLDEDFIKIDVDKDGINQAWEDAAMYAVNPYFVLDEDETWLTARNTLGHKVANFVRVTPWPSNDPQYILFFYCICWSRDYGRYMDQTSIFEAHNGDDEYVVLAWKIINNKNLELKYVATSAHGNMTSGHSGAWNAKGPTTVIGSIAKITISNITNIKDIEFTDIKYGDDPMVGTLDYNNNAVKLYVSEDKHAIYPSKSVGESVRLLYLPTPKPPLIGIPAVGFGWFVDEDVAEGPILQFECYNAGEPECWLMDDVGFIFPNERIWNGNIDNPDKFTGGLGYDGYSPGPIYVRLEFSTDSENQDPMEKVLMESLKH